MEDFKIRNYERENGVGTFIPFDHLSKTAAMHVFASLRRRLGVSEDFSVDKLTRAIQDACVIVEGFNALDNNFSLQSVLDELDYNTSGMVYLNWHRFIDIDELKLEDFSRIFKDVWYPSSDDIDIFDLNFGWLLSIEHFGILKALRFSKY